ncbi:uncharacterized protein LOC115034296 [Acyrthosiphon pisum]|uniref:MULE transposase domain-containing protein n=1 Tax=Acyrthosiphon pisum TaxID=7029 RepID=A0A8R2NS04_ACYPI|nr:uncharacterized protein LOC115034296 [Acyrthosiphon pisum]
MGLECCSSTIRNSANLTSNDMSLVKRNMYNARRKLMPPVPTSRSEVISSLIQMAPKTIRVESFLILSDLDIEIIIYSCITNLKYLCISETLYVDGTFHYCVKFFYQLFTFHRYFNGHYIPLVFCLLKDKKQETYINCFKSICEKCLELNVVLSPTEIVVDYELAIHNACKQIWPNVSLVGCRFHLSQSWWRAIQNFGLSVEYKSESEISKWLCLCFGLLFLSPENVPGVFVFTLEAIMPSDQRVIKFSDYLVDNYISDDTTFLPHLWANQSANLNQTTNACESFHSHLKDSFYKSHPNDHIFSKVLIEF